MTCWSPRHYLKFAEERERPARDLLGRVPISRPGRVYDLGCGPGNSTRLLVEAYPNAEVVGVDQSEEMLAEARRILPSRAFVLADLAIWQPDGPPDLLFSNAAFHWVSDHTRVLSRLATRLQAGGVLAVQMPDNLNEPSHRLIRDTAARGPWSHKLVNADDVREVLLSPKGYYDLLKPLCSSVEVWHTVYHHPLDGAAGIVTFLESTALRPFLGPLDESERVRFLEEYTARIDDVYPSSSDGKVLLGFPRLFIVATR